MTLPSILFALLIALLYGALYHFFRDGGFWRLVLYLCLSVAGFAAGQALGFWLGWDFIALGLIDLGFSTLGSLIFLVIGDWLSRIE